MIVPSYAGVDGEDFREIIGDIDLEALAADEDGVKNRGAFAGLGMPDEQPVLFTDGCGSDRVFHGVLSMATWPWLR